MKATCMGDQATAAVALRATSPRMGTGWARHGRTRSLSAAVLLSNQAARRRVALGLFWALVLALTPLVHIQPARAATPVGGSYHSLANPARILVTRIGSCGDPTDI